MKLDNITENCPTCGGHGRVPVRDEGEQARDVLARQLQALKDFLETCLCTECGGIGTRPGQHCDDSPRVECDACLGTGHDSAKAFERAMKAEAQLARVRRDTLREAAEALDALQRREVITLSVPWFVSWLRARADEQEAKR